MDGRSRPYFYGVDQKLNFQQREALAQGIQQVVETTPAGFEFFEFQFVGHQVYIYKLDHGIILLVLTSDNLVSDDYRHAVLKLQTELQQDAANAIATFRLLAGNISLTNQNYWKNRSEPASSTLHVTPSDHAAAHRNGTHGAIAPPHPSSPPAAPAPTAQQAPAPSQARVSSPHETGHPSTDIAPCSLNDAITALNYLSQLAARYLGNTVVTNYLKVTRPSADWLNGFQIDRAAHISCVDPAAYTSQPLNVEQRQWIQDWIEAFVLRCTRVIRDFATILEQSPLDDSIRTILLPRHSSP